jgi:hypothetical protein
MLLHVTFPSPKLVSISFSKCFGENSELSLNRRG